MRRLVRRPLSARLDGLCIGVGFLVAGLLAPTRAEPPLAANTRDRSTTETVRMDRTSDGYVRSIGAPPGRSWSVAATGTGRDARTRAHGFLREQRALFGWARDGTELRVQSVREDRGRTYVRFEQRYRGLPILGAGAVVQIEASGGVSFVLADLARDGAVLHGDSFSTAPHVGEGSASAAALDRVTEVTGDNELTVGFPQLMLFEPSVIGLSGSSRLVWSVRVKDASGSVSEVLLVDARSGDVAFQYSEILEARDRQIHEGRPPGSLIRSEGGAESGMVDADRVYDALGNAYDFYFRTFGRDSFDGAGAHLIARVCSGPSVGCWSRANAFWNGSEMRFGDGSAVAEDIVAHEVNHALTASESGLIYWGESGAISEALADIFGELVDLASPGGGDDTSSRWLLGEDLPLGAIRSLADPTLYGHPDRRFSPLWHTSPDDNQGVHTNSGVANKLAFLLSEGGVFNGQTVTGLGPVAVAELFHEVQVHLLVPASDYYDLDAALAQAAVNLAWSKAARDNLRRAREAVEIAGGPSSLTVSSGPLHSTVDRPAFHATGGSSGEPSAGRAGDVTTGRDCPAGVVNRYRLYSPVTKEHHYTTDLNEYTTLGTWGWVQEGVAHQVFPTDASVYGQNPVPLYRLYHAGIRQHLWTTDTNEYAVLGGLGWTQEGIDGYILAVEVSGVTTPLYRLAYAFEPLHLWTVDFNEYQTLASLGWIQEGIAGHVVSCPANPACVEGESRTQACPVTNGVGTETLVCEGGVWNSVLSCEVDTCNDLHFERDGACLSLSAQGVIHYVRPDGNDSADGRSHASAWRTLDKVTSMLPTLAPGDSVLLERGASFHGSLTVDADGLAERPIVIGAYGQGDQPVISGLIGIDPQGWQLERNGVYRTPVPAATTPLNLVLVDGVNTPLGRHPNIEFYVIDSANSIYSVTSSQLLSAPNWSNAEAVIRKNWYIVDRHPTTTHDGATLYLSTPWDHDRSYDARAGYGFFIQRDIDTLDLPGEWHFGSATGQDGHDLFVYFGGDDPADHAVAVSIVDTLVEVSGSHHVVLDGLRLEGANTTSVVLNVNDDVTIQNCTVEFSGQDGIQTGFDWTEWAPGTNGVVVFRNTLSEIANNAIDIGFGAAQARIVRNRVTNTGMNIGMIRGRDRSGIGIAAFPDNTLIEHNEVVNTGFNGIHFSGLNTQVDSNLVDTFCVWKEDCGGIYTYGFINDMNAYVRENIVLHASKKAPRYGFPWRWRTHENQGIYLDDHTRGVSVVDNTVAFADLHGLYFHNTAEITATGNTLFSHDYFHMRWYHDGSNPEFRFKNMRIENNIMVSIRNANKMFNFHSYSEHPSGLGVSDYNLYVTPAGGVATFMKTFQEQSTDYSFAAWQVETGLESHSTTRSFPFGESETGTSVRFEYNASRAEKLIRLDEPMLDVTGVLHTGWVKLMPYRSIVLYPAS
jgi:Zn-dependent metalloprotease